MKTKRDGIITMDRRSTMRPSNSLGHSADSGAALDMNIGPISYGFQISTEKRRGAISCAVPLIFSAWRKDAYRANWRYRAGGDRILLPEPRASACRRKLRVGTDQRSCRHTRPCSEHERQRPGQTMRIVLVVQHEVARTSTAPYNEGRVRTFM